MFMPEKKKEPSAEDVSKMIVAGPIAIFEADYKYSETPLVALPVSARREGEEPVHPIVASAAGSISIDYAPFSQSTAHLRRAEPQELLRDEGAKPAGENGLKGLSRKPKE
jgi:hypothetical protein